MVEVPTPDELRTLLATVIAGVAGGSIPDWRAKVGPVTKLPLHSHIRCNWLVDPPVDGNDFAVIAQAAAVVRGAHPYVAG